MWCEWLRDFSECINFYFLNFFFFILPIFVYFIVCFHSADIFFLFCCISIVYKYVFFLLFLYEHATQMDDESALHCIAFVVEILWERRNGHTQSYLNSVHALLTLLSLCPNKFCCNYWNFYFFFLFFVLKSTKVIPLKRFLLPNDIDNADTRMRIFTWEPKN